MEADLFSFPSLAYIAPAGRVRRFLQFIGSKLYRCELVPSCRVYIFKSFHGYIKPYRDSRRHSERTYSSRLKSGQFLYSVPRYHAWLCMEDGFKLLTVHAAVSGHYNDHRLFIYNER